MSADETLYEEKDGIAIIAGYDLTAQGKWDTPYGAPDIETREGAWDPVRDLQFMGNNVRRGYAPSRVYGTPTTMLWIYRLTLEHAKQFLLTGRAIDAETALRIRLVSHVVPADEIESFIEAEAPLYRNIPSNQLALNKLRETGRRLSAARGIVRVARWPYRGKLLGASSKGKGHGRSGRCSKST